MTLQERKKAFVQLGLQINQLTPDETASLARRSAVSNAWFDEENVSHALSSIAGMLTADQLNKWLENYEPISGSPKKTGVVMAGNIPGVGFHDMLCTLIGGHTLFAKLSKEDPYLPKWITDQLIAIEPRFEEKVNFPELLKNMDAIIATGSDNTARYFDYYFRNTPHIIRQNRTSCAVIGGFESNEELAALGADIFRYYGLGCRNISKVLVPEDYDFIPLLNALQPWEAVLQHHKYRNNYDYNKSIYLVNRQHHLDTGYLLVTQSEQLVSPISVLYYEEYQDQPDLEQKLAKHAPKLQAVVSAQAWYKGSIPFGMAQQPAVWEYADKADTLQFLGLLE